MYLLCKTHEANNCPAKDAVCNYCSKKGHWISVCFKKEADEKQNASSSSFQPKKHLIKTKSGENSDEAKVSNINIHQISKKTKRKYIDVQLNNAPIQLQIDSGADVSVISKSKCKQLNITYQPTSLRPTNASGTELSLVGEFETNVTFDNTTVQTTIYVSGNNTLNVFGSELLDVFGLWDKPINEFCSSSQIHSISIPDEYVNFLKSNFNSCFEKTLGHCTK